MDGYLKIKTKIDNKDVDKGIVELENKIKKLQDDNSKSSKEQASLEKEINQYKELYQKAEQYKNKIKELKKEKEAMLKGNPALAVQMDTSELTLLNSQIEETKQKYSQATKEIDKQASKIEKVYFKLEKVKSKQVENNAKISQYKQKIEQININKIKKSLDTVGKNLQTQIGKIGKMAFVVIGLRTAWSAVRSAISSVSQYNSQVSVDFEYMRYCIANLIAPAVQGLIKLLYTVLSYINAITSAWFGINLFSNSSVKAFQKMQSSASGAATSAKEMQKSLQGFDEKNVMSNTSNSSSGGSGVDTPGTDLSDIQGDVPKWLQWIVNNKEIILSTLAGIAGGITGIKLLNFLSELGLIENKLLGIKALGIGVLIAGIVYTIQSLLEYLKNPTWENFGEIIQGIGVALLGLALIVGSVPLAVTGAVVLIVGIITKYWEQIKSFLQSGIDWLTSKIDWVRDNFGILGETIYKIFIDVLQLVLNIFDNVFKTIKGVFDGIVQFIKGVFTGNWQQAWDGLKQIFSSVWNGIKGIVTSVFTTIKNTISNIVNGIWNIIKGLINSITGGINILIKGINKISFDVPDWVPGIGGKKFGFNIPEIPQLARGGIISQPTQAIIGEAGKEAVVPLENNLEWLDILATKIAGKINTNGNVSVYLDGRLIQRQIAKREQQLAFAQNGR